MIEVSRAFAPSYARARVQFLEAAATAGMQITSYNHPLPGRDGETLAMDVAREGSLQADRLLVVSSACHGVEGYCGSGVQVFAAHDAEWRAKARAAGVAVLYIHALNPHGFSWVRRVTHENVDLNRNFQDFSQPLPTNEAYAELHARLIPPTWPPSDDNERAIERFIAERGLASYQAAVSQGQHAFPNGLFFGGTSPTWSHLTLRQILRIHGQHARHIGWIDLHTGLGPSGVGERIFAGHDNSQALARARDWWGGGETPVTSIYDGSSTSAPLTGMMWSALPQECPQAVYTGIALEYGTVPITEVVNALRADQWLSLHPEADAELAKSIKRQVMDAFYVDTDEWRGQVVAQSRQALFQAVEGLARV